MRPRQQLLHHGTACLHPCHHTFANMVALAASTGPKPPCTCEHDGLMQQVLDQAVSAELQIRGPVQCLLTEAACGGRADLYSSCLLGCGPCRRGAGSPLCLLSCHSIIDSTRATVAAGQAQTWKLLIAPEQPRWCPPGAGSMLHPAVSGVNEHLASAKTSSTWGLAVCGGVLVPEGCCALYSANFTCRRKGA